MEPDFCDGHVIVIDRDVQPEEGDLVVIKYSGAKDFLFGQYFPRPSEKAEELVFDLVPFNRSFATVRIDRDHPALIFGTVVRNFRPNRRF